MAIPAEDFAVAKSIGAAMDFMVGFPSTGSFSASIGPYEPLPMRNCMTVGRPSTFALAVGPLPCLLHNLIGKCHHTLPPSPSAILVRHLPV